MIAEWNKDTVFSSSMLFLFTRLNNFSWYNPRTENESFLFLNFPNRHKTPHLYENSHSLERFREFKNDMIIKRELFV